MKGFIRLTDRRCGAIVNINPEHIVATKDLRSDNCVKDMKVWHWSVVDTLTRTYEVRESEKEIFKLITEL